MLQFWYALETDWLVGAAGFEPLHLEIESAELHPASTGFRRRSGAPLIRDAQVRVPPPGLGVLANSDSNMQRSKSRRPSQPVRLKRTPNIKRSLKNRAVPLGFGMGGDRCDMLLPRVRVRRVGHLSLALTTCTRRFACKGIRRILQLHGPYPTVTRRSASIPYFSERNCFTASARRSDRP